jgi:hypothetical protein
MPENGLPVSWKLNTNYNELRGTILKKGKYLATSRVNSEPHFNSKLMRLAT